MIKKVGKKNEEESEREREGRLVVDRRNFSLWEFLSRDTFIFFFIFLTSELQILVYYDII